MRPGEPCGPMRLPASFNEVYALERRRKKNNQSGLAKTTIKNRAIGRLTVGPPKRASRKRCRVV